MATLVNSGQMSREEALAILQTPTYEEKLLKQDYEFILKKLDYTKEEFEALMSTPAKKHEDYKHQLPFSLEYPKITKTIRQLFLKR